MIKQKKRKNIFFGNLLIKMINRKSFITGIKGVKLNFMGLNNQNLHNMLFRGFLKPWEKYTGAEINWIDLAQADYNARLQQSIATGTVDFDIIEMGAPFEGDVCGKGMASEMPDWVAQQIDMDDYVGSNPYSSHDY